MKHTARHRAPRPGFRRVAVAGTAALVPLMAAAPTASADPLNDLINAGSSAAGHIGNIAITGATAPNIDAAVDAVVSSASLTPSNYPAPDGTAAAAAPVISTGQKIVDAARSQIGTPYVWGGTGPGGFDCSGLTSWSYSQVGKSIPRTSQDQAAAGAPVSSSNLQPGDIIAFYAGATHVGIYSGGGNVIHAPQAGQNVHETSMSYMPFHSAVRY